MSASPLTNGTSLLPPVFSPQRFFLNAPKQPDGTCFVLDSDFQLAMAEVARLQLSLTTAQEHLAVESKAREGREALLQENERLSLSLTASDERYRTLRESLQRIPTHVVLDVSEIPDRDSPDNQPEMMLVTGPELADIVAHWLNNALEGVS